MFPWSVQEETPELTWHPLAAFEHCFLHFSLYVNHLRSLKSFRISKCEAGTDPMCLTTFQIILRQLGF